MKIVTAAILRKHGRVLIARRARGVLAGRWEFPGGKLEPGESERDCLARELKEELGIEVEVGEFVAESVYDYGGGSITLRAYEATWISGDLNPVDHDKIEWVEIAALHTYDLLPADLPIADRLLMGRE